MLTFVKAQFLERSSGMNIGVSSACFFPCDTIESLNICADCGFGIAEIFANTHSELMGEYLKDVKKITSDRNIRITSIHPFTSGYEYILFFAGYDKRIDDAIEYYKNYFECAAALGAKYVIFHGDNRRAPFVGVERYAEIFSRLDEASKPFGVRVAQENVSTSHIGSPENIRKLRSLLPDIQFTFDIKQACRGGFDPFDMLDAMGSNVRHVHLNDWNGEDCALPCKGVCDLKGLAAKLDSVNYGGDYIIEVYRRNFENCRDLHTSKTEFLKLFDKGTV